MINYSNTIAAAHIAVKLVHDIEVDMYMKAFYLLKFFLKVFQIKKQVQKLGEFYVRVFEVKGIDQLLFLTDQEFIIYPTLEEKVKIIENSLEITNACGAHNPKVAPLPAVEVANPKMPVTLDVVELTK